MTEILVLYYSRNGKTAQLARLVARVQNARLCRCGHSNTKPFCDNTHQRIGFKS